MTRSNKTCNTSSTFEKFIRFGVTGALGTLVNLMFFFLFVDVFELPAIPASIVCFIIAATQNYYINHYWTFSNHSADVSFKNWAKYLLAALAGLAVNLIVLKFTMHWFSYISVSQLLGILSGFLINFIVAKIYVFKA